MVTVATIGSKFRMYSKQMQLVVAWLLMASVRKCCKEHLAAIIDIYLFISPRKAKEIGQGKSCCDCKLNCFEDHLHY